MTAFSFRLPWPPSLNNYFVERAVRQRNTGKLIVLKHPGSEGLEYRLRVAHALLMQSIPRDRLTGRLGVRIVAHPPDRRARDLDNLLKATLDALTHARLYVDDSAIDDLHVLRGQPCQGGRLDLTVEEIVGIGTGELFENGNRIKPGGKSGSESSVSETLAVMGAPA